MTISANNLTQQRSGDTVIVNAISDLTPPVYFHWYRDGAYVGMTNAGHFEFQLRRDEAITIDVLDTTNPNFDPVAQSPVLAPGADTLWWYRSPDADVMHYRVEIKQTGPIELDWEPYAVVPVEADRWAYKVLTTAVDEPPDAGGSYAYRVLPVDSNGNDGTALEVSSFVSGMYARAPNWIFAYDAGTRRVTYGFGS